jgi:hypothetical protein
MSTKQNVLSLGSIVILALLASPCAAQTIIYVRDAAGYVRPVVIPRTTAFAMGMTVQPVVSPDDLFVRLNVGSVSISMPDPAATIPVLVPNRTFGIFSNGNLQPPLISQKLVVLGGQGGFSQFSFGGQPFAPSGQVGQFQPNPFALMSMQRPPQRRR